MKNNKSSVEQQNKLLREIFGKLIVEYTCKEHTTYYEGQARLFSYTILKRDENKLLVQFIDRECDKTVVGQDLNFGESCYNACDDAITEQEITLDGDCYSVTYELLGYKEVFCRIN